MNSTHRWLIRTTTAGAALLPALAEAHPGHGVASGFIAGALHPLSGVDHLCALIAVGLLAGRIGGRAAWLLLASYLCLLVQGAAMAMAGLQLPFVQALVVVSIAVCALLAVAPPRRLPGAIIALAAFFAFFHGFAHGMGALPGAPGWQFLVGLAASSAAVLALVAWLAAAASRLPQHLSTAGRTRSRI